MLKRARVSQDPQTMMTQQSQFAIIYYLSGPSESCFKVQTESANDTVGVLLMILCHFLILRR